MKTNWKTAINKINSARLRIPDGWETKEQVAASLECDPDRVGDILKPGIACGEIERQDFPTWDEARRMAVRVVCYRTRPQGESKPTANTLEDKIRDHIRRHPAKPNSHVAKCFKGATSAMVAAIRKEAK